MSGTQKMARPKPVRGPRREDAGKGRSEDTGKGRSEGKGKGKGRSEGKGKGKGTRKGKGKGKGVTPTSFSSNNVSNLNPVKESRGRPQPFRSITMNTVSSIAKKIAQRKANNPIENIRRMVVKNKNTFKQRKERGKEKELKYPVFNPADYNAAFEQYKKNHMPVLSRSPNHSYVESWSIRPPGPPGPFYVNGEFPFRPPGNYQRSDSDPYIPLVTPKVSPEVSPKVNIDIRSDSPIRYRSKSPMYDPDNPRR